MQHNIYSIFIFFVLIRILQSVLERGISEMEQCDDHAVHYAILQNTSTHSAPKTSKFGVKVIIIFI